MNVLFQCNIQYTNDLRRHLLFEVTLVLTQFFCVVLDLITMLLVQFLKLEVVSYININWSWKSLATLIQIGVENSG